jgi:hypothetical protein
MASMLWCAGSFVLRSTVEELNLLPTNGLEPAPLTSEALVAQYLYGSYTYLKQLIIQTVHILQLDTLLQILREVWSEM